MPNGHSILQNTFLRTLELAPSEIINVTSNEFIFKVRKEWDELSHAGKAAIEPTYILEPFGRNTAAAIAMVSLYIAEKYGDDAIVLALPSDHLIAKQQSFNEVVINATKLASQDKIVTFGIKPDAPETGYGYIEHEGNVVNRFVEKPSEEKAQEYIKSCRYLWNSGMFCFKANVMLQEMSTHCPDILASSIECFAASKSPQHHVLNIDPKTFESVRDDSIDYAVMEKSDKVAVVPCDIGWSDIGNWSSISQMQESDDNGNVINGEVILEKTQDCYIESDKRLIAAVGIENLIIVDTPDALLVANKNNAQDVKQIYNSLAKSGHQTHEVHTTVFRPWGSYTVLEESENFKIKRIVVNPGASLSLQSHKFRSEHWVVVAGTATVFNGENQLLLNVNESTYIPAGNKHRLSNPSETEFLSIIEVQTGSYLGEDDIQRFEDMYSRATVELNA